jgi:hypothetical protein
LRHSLGEISETGIEQDSSKLLINGYTILSIFICLLRFVLSVTVVSVGVSTWRYSKQRVEESPSELVENRSYLLILSAIVLIGLNVISWPILYLLLQRLVQEWPSAMCIYGVTQIGAGSVGISRFLPTLLTGLQWTKPILLFIGGTSFILYLINRRTQHAPLMHRVLLLFLFTGVFSVVDSVTEGTYLLIPKSEIRPGGGCCTNTLESVRQTSQFTPIARVTEQFRPSLIATYFILNLSMILGLFLRLTIGELKQSLCLKLSLLVLGAALIPVNLLFLIEIAAPAILGLPFHHCPYDLVSAAPESVFGVALFLLGCFGLGWSFVVEILGRCDQTQGFLHEFVEKLMFIALFGYTGSLLIFSLELFLAR